VTSSAPLLLSGVTPLLARAHPNGGFVSLKGEASRPDATAWAAIVLRVAGVGLDLIDAARSQLVLDQFPDGRISIAPTHQESFWPTPLAVLAWQGAPSYLSPQERAIHYLLDTTGRHANRRRDEPIGHDPAILGWPWVRDTHSWVEPTALTLIALSVAGHAQHPRVKEAARLLMDRQLRGGGWNYGNTTVFGQELRPDPESTGAALHALAGFVPYEEVQLSVQYLAKIVGRLRTPIALGWSLLGLQSWHAAPDKIDILVQDCLSQQARFGDYDTASLSLVLLPALTRMGLWVT